MCYLSEFGYIFLLFYSAIYKNFTDYSKIVILTAKLIKRPHVSTMSETKKKKN